MRFCYLISGHATHALFVLSYLLSRNAQGKGETINQNQARLPPRLHQKFGTCTTIDGMVVEVWTAVPCTATGVTATNASKRNQAQAVAGKRERTRRADRVAAGGSARAAPAAGRARRPPARLPVLHHGPAPPPPPPPHHRSPAAAEPRPNLTTIANPHLSPCPGDDDSSRPQHCTELERRQHGTAGRQRAAREVLKMAGAEVGWRFNSRGEVGGK